MSTDRTFVVPVWSIDRLEKAVKSLQRAAKRAGITPEPTLTVRWETKRELGQKQETVILDGASVEAVQYKVSVIPVVDCTLQLPDSGRIALPGEWRVLAVLQRVETPAPEGVAAPRASRIENEIFCSPELLPKVENFRTCELACEHCKANRFRTKTLVLEEGDTGTLKQVGKECAELYVGDRADAMIHGIEFQKFVTEVLQPYAESETELWAGWSGKGVGSTLTAWDAEEVMAHACACVRTLGWQPSKIESGYRYSGFGGEMVDNPDATAKKVAYVLENADRMEALSASRMEERAKYESALAELRKTPTPEGDKFIPVCERKIAAIDSEPKWEPPYAVEETDRVEARKLIGWLGEQSPAADDQYLPSLKAVFAPGWVSEKRLAFAVSLVRAYSRAQEQAEWNSMVARSNYVSQPGTRTEFTLRLLRATPYSGEFPGTAYTFCDEAGNLYSWLTSSAGPDCAVGDTIRVKATVSKHETYRSAKQTVLSRVKELPMPSNDAPLPKTKGTKRTKAHA